MRRDVEFVSCGAILRGWLDLPEPEGPHPAVVITPGFGGVKETFLDADYPAVLCRAGLAVLTYDHINSGASGGLPRQELDPLMQQRGYRDAVTFLSTLAEIDSDRIGLWGSSFSGGHVLAVAAADRRVRCVVAQAMTISGRANMIRRHSPSAFGELRAAWAADRIDRLQGRSPKLVQAFPDDSEIVTFIRSRPDHTRQNWRNEITLHTWELYAEYEPAAFIERISPTPLLMIVPLDDATTPAEDALAAYARALEPKHLLTLRGSHTSVYRENFATTSTAAADWFHRHLVVA